MRKHDRSVCTSQQMKRGSLSIVMLLGAIAVALVNVVQVQAAAIGCGTVPDGQANPSPEPEPMTPVWCLNNLVAEPTTRQVDQWGGWQDNFQTNVQLGRMNNGDMGYRVFDDLSNGGGVQTLHFVNNNHWMVDMTHNNGGAAIAPNESFHFQNGKLVVEADVAAGIPGYIGNVWPEVVWSTAPAPGNAVDGLYLYGHFGGSWASGCRLQSERTLTCSLEADHTVPTNGDKPPCFSFGDTRVFELSGFEYCGSTHSGFAADFGGPRGWRQCQANQMDMFCRDRFRFEWSQTGLVAYVNGIKFAEDSGWPSYAQIPTSIASGSVPVYVYFGEWADFSDGAIYRLHWGRVAVNPHDAVGNPLGPSPAPSFCPGQTQNTCAMGTMNPASGGIGMAAMGNGSTGTTMTGSGANIGMGSTSSMTNMPGTQGGHPAQAKSGGSDEMTTGEHAGPNLFAETAVAHMLNGGQQPTFWIVLGTMLLGGVAAGVVVWLWLGGPLGAGRRSGNTPAPPPSDSG
jgi:hypothetical protein